MILASGDSALGAGFIAFLVFAALCVAVYFLGRSLFKHLRRVPDKFDDRTVVEVHDADR